MWATGRILEVATQLLDHTQFEAVPDLLLAEANEIAEDDVRVNLRLSTFGASLVKQGANILHHCNTGRLASIDYGTALGVVYRSQEEGKNVHVWVDETRPRLQGAKLTAWELMEAKVPMTLIPDNASGHLMLSGKIDIILFGADRVAANGDVANKIGTLNICMMGQVNNIPRFACVPTSTIDLSIPSGEHIPIELRDEREVTEVDGVRVAPPGVKAFNPAFDVTPSRFLTGIITEAGICYPPFEESLRKAVLSENARSLEAREARLKLYTEQTRQSKRAKTD